MRIFGNHLSQVAMELKRCTVKNYLLRQFLIQQEYYSSSSIRSQGPCVQSLSVSLVSSEWESKFGGKPFVPNPGSPIYNSEPRYFQELARQKSVCPHTLSSLCTHTTDYSPTFANCSCFDLPSLLSSICTDLYHRHPKANKFFLPKRKNVGIHQSFFPFSLFTFNSYVE